jgi:four helix bundle protein
MKDFRKLEIWKKGMEIAKQVYAFTGSLPQKEQFGLISQMNRCSVSIPSNIAEGCSRNSDIELKRFIEIAMGSAFELETQLLLTKEIYQKEDVSLFVNLNQLQKMMNAYHSKLKATPNTNYSQSPITKS